MFDKSRIPTFYELTEAEQNEVRQRFKGLKRKQKSRSLSAEIDDEYFVEFLSKALLQARTVRAYGKRRSHNCRRL